MTPTKRNYWGLTIFVVVGALAVGALLRADVFHISGQSVLGAQRAQKVSFKTAQSTTPVSLADFKNGFSTVIDPALSAVVNISSTKVVKRPNMPGLFNDPFFQQFFGDQRHQPQEGPQSPQGPQAGPQTEREYSLGSGVIVNPDGYILTNNHVVTGASDVEVFTRDRKKYKAKIVGTDARTDVAVLKVEATGLPTLAIGDSSKLKVGDLVFAIGDPFGIGETATSGIVSATGRALGGAIEHYENFIQTDASINPGNSGGALIDLHGDLIGVNTAILSGGGGGNQGIGFAIPVNMARNVMQQIVEHGKVVRGYMGVTIQSVNPDIAKAFGLSHGGGALVGDVSPNSPASKAGLERGDIVTELNGKPVESSDQLSVDISQMAPGSVAHLKIVRNGKEQNVDVTLAEFPENQQSAQEEGQQGEKPVVQGLQVENLTSDIARQLGLQASSYGVVVDQVDPDSPAAAAGVNRGDVIQEVNHKPVHNVREYRQALSGAGNQPVLLLLNREGTTHFVIIQPQ